MTKPAFTNANACTMLKGAALQTQYTFQVYNDSTAAITSN